MANMDVLIDFSQLEELISKQKDSERLITDWLQIFGYPIAEEESIKVLPRSNKSKRHAKDSNPFKMVARNLGFELVSKGGAASNKNSFGYLVFPDEGRGKSNPIAQNFMDRGKENALKEMIPILQENLINYLGGK